MKFKDLYRLYKNKIVFQHPGEDEEKARDKVYSFQKFENWFKKNESNLIWNEEAQGYDCNINVSISELNLSIIPIQFNIINASFYCALNKLSLLKGCPRRVKNSFDCSNNKLTSLKDCPEEIGGDFYCALNRLVSLKGCPEEINGVFDCSNNELTSLESCPKEVEKDFYCDHNKVTFSEEEIRSRCKVGGKIYI